MLCLTWNIAYPLKQTQMPCQFWALYSLPSSLFTFYFSLLYCLSYGSFLISVPFCSSLDSWEWRLLALWSGKTLFLSTKLSYNLIILTDDYVSLIVNTSKVLRAYRISVLDDLSKLLSPFMLLTPWLMLFQTLDLCSLSLECLFALQTTVQKSPLIQCPWFLQETSDTFSICSHITLPRLYFSISYSMFSFLSY